MGRAPSHVTPLVFSLAVALAASFLVACSGEGADEADGTSGSSDDALAASVSADAALNDMLNQFWDTGRGEFRANETSYWINAQAFDAVLDGVQRSHEKEFTHWVSKIRDGNEKEFGGFFTSSYKKTYFDDITWMTLALIRASDLSSGSAKAGYLADAEHVFQYVIDHAQSESNGKFAGLWWVSTHDMDEKATASNFGPVIAAARLFTRTKKPTYKSFALGVYGYWHTNMVQTQSDGTAFVVDNIQNGKKSSPRFTYNQGLGIGAAVAISDLANSAAEKESFLEEARAMADYLVKHETRDQVLIDYDSDDKTISTCTGDCAAFKGIAYRYLAELYQLDLTRADYYQILHSSAHAILANDHDASAHRFGTRWDIGGHAGDGDLNANASAVMALQIFARLPAPTAAK